MIKQILKITFIGVLSLIVLFVLIVFRLFAIKIYDSQIQIRHMKNLEEMYESNYEPIDESSFVDFDRFDNLTTLDEIQMLASHNSYKKKGSPLGKLFVGLGDSFAEARALKYEYKNLTDQFEAGIRSMEFDVRKRKSSFVLTHVPLVDNSSVAPDFSLALEEIYLYSSNNPTHIPMIFLVEVKTDWMILDHALQDIDEKELEELNDLIKDKLKDSLYTPADMIKEGLTLSETIDQNGWPTVTSLLGKVIFVLHPGEMNESYFNLDSTLKSQSMFIGSYESNLTEVYTSFVVHNSVDTIRIQEIVSEGYIVRTRIDENLIFDETRYLDAISSGAQILTSDFSQGRKDLKASDMITLQNYTVRKRI